MLQHEISCVHSLELPQISSPTEYMNNDLMTHRNAIFYKFKVFDLFVAKNIRFQLIIIRVHFKNIISSFLKLYSTGQ